MPNSLEAYGVRQYGRRGEYLTRRTDTPVVLRIKHIGSAAVTSGAVTVTAATNIVLVDADATSTLAFSTYTTVGMLADAINNLANWECRVLDALRADATASMFVTGAITSGTTRAGIVVWDVLQDTSLSFNLTACAHIDRDFAVDNGSNWFKDHCVQLKKAIYSVDMGTAAINSALVVARNGGAETTIISDLSVDTTATTMFDFTSSENFLGGRNGEELIVRIKDAAALADATGNYLNITYFVV